VFNPFKKYAEKKQKQKQEQRVDEFLQFSAEIIKMQEEINKPKPKSAWPFDDEFYR